jgi:Rieske Fe-S protein
MRLADDAREEFSVPLEHFPELQRPGGRLRVRHPSAGTILLARTGKQVVALSAVCTHQGCSVTPSGDGFRCPCHGSTFDATGGVESGPARVALTRFNARATADRIIVRLEGAR